MIACTACFDAQYGPASAYEIFPATDPMLMMTPVLSQTRKHASAARIPWRTPITFVSKSSRIAWLGHASSAPIM